jgi:quercetin dioxygenase-like cupin family protein
MTDGEVRHYTAGQLTLKEDIPGAAMWAVALDKAMLTYFEVQPGRRFEAHSHESEQITMVLEGCLFFEAAGRVFPVGEKEVIAVPANVSHAVFTGDAPAKAIDAWAPVMAKYRE